MDQKDKRELGTVVARRDRRLPGKVLGRRAAIMSMCSECVGHDSGGLGSVAAAVRACPAVKCHLWPWRNGKLDEEAFEK